MEATWTVAPSSKVGVLWRRLASFAGRALLSAVCRRAEECAEMARGRAEHPCIAAPPRQRVFSQAVPGKLTEVPMLLFRQILMWVYGCESSVERSMRLQAGWLLPTVAAWPPRALAAPSVPQQGVRYKSASKACWSNSSYYCGFAELQVFRLQPPTCSNGLRDSASSTAAARAHMHALRCWHRQLVDVVARSLLCSLGPLCVASCCRSRCSRPRAGSPLSPARPCIAAARPPRKRPQDAERHQAGAGWGRRWRRRRCHRGRLRRLRPCHPLQVQGLP